jgi:TolB protein
MATTTTTTIGTISEFPGRLVVVDQVGNIVTIDPDGSDQSAVTADAGQTATYAQPSWSPQSDRIAWAEITDSGVGVGLSGAQGDERTVIPMNAPPFYLYWSPDGQSIGVLHNGLQAIEFEVVDVEAASTSIVASGSPFYFSWSPESDRVVAHVQGDIFAVIHRDGIARDLGDTGAGYQSPHWTPSGIFHLGEGGLEVRDVAGEAQILARAPGSVALVANPQGTRVAVQAIDVEEPGGITAAVSEIPVLPSNAVAVVDVATGAVAEVTLSPSIGFFWSPDGEALLVLEPTGSAAEVDVKVWADGETRRLFTIAPQPAFVREVLQFFDQYSQSLRLWSPDSSAVVLVGEVGDEQGVWVHDLDQSDPVKVFDGGWAVWSNG